MDLINSLSELPLYFLPLATFLIGLLGSVHCMGMCAPLVLATTQSKKQVLEYQLGRLIGYVFLAMIILSFGSGFRNALSSTIVFDIAVYLLALTIIAYGISIALKGKLDFKTFGFLGRFSSQIYQSTRPYLADSQFLIGALSIFLPCGMLYGLLAVILVSENPMMGILSVIAFWMGTLPGLVFGSQFLSHISKRFKKTSPILSSLLFMTIGLVTIYMRHQASLESCCH